MSDEQQHRRRPERAPGDGPDDVVLGRNRRGMIGSYLTFLRDGSQRAEFRRARRGLSLPAASRPAPPGAVWAVGMVKDEADIVGATVGHLLAQGVDRVLVVDNGSADGTAALLHEFADTDDRLLVGRDTEVGYLQAAKTTLLARHAARMGAAWVVPFDADEFWFARGARLVDYLRATPASVAQASLYNVFPTEEPGRFRMETRPHEYPKVAFRPHRLALLRTGNHWVSRSGERALGLRIAHYPWRSREQFARKVRQGAAAYAATDLPADQGAHWRELGRLDGAALAASWSDVLRGRHDDRVGWSPAGPFVTADPRTWSEWDAAAG